MISYKKNYNWKFVNLHDITSQEIKQSYSDAFVVAFKDGEKIEF